MASVINNATLAQVQALETEWNAAIQAEYDSVDAKYPDINFDDLSGRLVSINPEISDVHPVTGDAIITGWNKKTLSNVRVTKEIINAIKKKSVMFPTTDDDIFFEGKILYDSDEFVTGAIYKSKSIEDEDEDGVTIKGLRTLATENRLTINIDDNNVKTLSWEDE